MSKKYLLFSFIIFPIICFSSDKILINQDKEINKPKLESEDKKISSVCDNKKDSSNQNRSLTQKDAKSIQSNPKKDLSGNEVSKKQLQKIETKVPDVSKNVITKATEFTKTLNKKNVSLEENKKLLEHQKKVKNENIPLTKTADKSCVKNDKNNSKIIDKNSKPKSNCPKITSIYVYENEPPKEIPLNRGVLINACITNKIKDGLCYELKKFLDKEICSNTSDEIKQKIINTLVSLSEPFVMVKECYQNKKDGVFIFCLDISHLCKINFCSSKYFRSTLLEKYFSIKRCDAIDLDEISLSLALLNRNPFRYSNAVFTPGDEPSTTNLTIYTKDRRPFRLYAGVENLGFEEIEKERFYVGANINNLFSLDQTLSYQFTASVEPKRFQAHTFDYSSPINWKNFLHVFGGGSKVKGDMNQGFLTRGKSSQVSIRYEIPLFVSKEWVHEMSLGFDYKRTNTNLEQGGFLIIKNAVNISQFVGIYKITKNWDCYRFFGDLQVFYGPGRMIHDQSNIDFSTLRPFAKNHYFYGRSHLDAIFFLPRNFAIQDVITAQVSSGNLLPSEQVGLGGLFSVRGYNERVENVDNAFINNFEVRTPHYYFCTQRRQYGEVQGIYFVDLGIGSNCKKIPTERDLYFLMGTGPGIRLSYKDNLTFQMDLGFPLNHLLHNKHPRVHFRANISY